MFTLQVRIITRTILYLIIASGFFLWFVNLLQLPEPYLTEEEIVSDYYRIDEVENNLIEKSNDLKRLKEEIETSKLNEYFNITPLKENNEIGDNYLHTLTNKFVFFEYIFHNDNEVIPIIYIIISITFLLQTLLLAWSNYYKELLKSKFFSEKKLDNIFIYSSEWAINVPPVLGVVGTIFSFAIVVSNLSDISNISSVFKDNFANAALTTIIGGSVYVLNLNINIFIAKNLARE